MTGTILTALFLFVASSGLYWNGGIIPTILRSLFLLKGTMLMGPPIAMGAFVMGQGSGLLIGKLMGMNYIYHKYIKPKHKRHRHFPKYSYNYGWSPPPHYYKEVTPYYYNDWQHFPVTHSSTYPQSPYGAYNYGWSSPHSYVSNSPHSYGWSSPHSYASSSPHSYGWSSPHSYGSSSPHSYGWSSPHSYGSSSPHSYGSSGYGFGYDTTGYTKVEPHGFHGAEYYTEKKPSYNSYPTTVKYSEPHYEKTLSDYFSNTESSYDNHPSSSPSEGETYTEGYYETSGGNPNTYNDNGNPYYSNSHESGYHYTDSGDEAYKESPWMNEYSEGKTTPMNEYRDSSGYDYTESGDGAYKESPRMNEYSEGKTTPMNEYRDSSGYDYTESGDGAYKESPWMNEYLEGKTTPMNEYKDTAESYIIENFLKSPKSERSLSEEKKLDVLAELLRNQYQAELVKSMTSYTKPTLPNSTPIHPHAILKPRVTIKPIQVTEEKEENKKLNSTQIPVSVSSQIMDSVKNLDANDFVPDQLMSWLLNGRTGEEPELTLHHQARRRREAPSTEPVDDLGSLDTKKVTASFVQDVQSLFTVVSFLDINRCLEKMICEIHSRDTKNRASTKYERNIVTAFRIMDKVIPLEVSKADSTTKYRQAAHFGHKSRSAGNSGACKQKFQACNLSTESIIRLGNIPVPTVENNQKVASVDSKKPLPSAFKNVEDADANAGI